MELELRGKSVIVTGGGSNIGRAISLAFADEGAKVVMAELDREQGERVAAGAADLDGEIVVVETDVTDLDQVTAMVGTAIEENGEIDVLVNNVGWDRLMYFVQTEPAFWRQVIDVNFVGLLNCVHTVLQGMVKTGGSIVAISSDASRQGEPREAVYGAMKAGINSFMKTIAKENGRFGVRCNVVCPGVTVPTESAEVGDRSMWAGGAMFTAEQLERIAANLPLKKLGTAEDIARAALFLASERTAGNITGQVLSVSGGYSMVG